MKTFISLRPGFLGELFFYLDAYRIEKDISLNMLELNKIFMLIEYLLISILTNGAFFKKVKILKTKIKEVLRWQRRVRNHFYLEGEMVILSPLREENSLLAQGL